MLRWIVLLCLLAVSSSKAVEKSEVKKRDVLDGYGGVTFADSFADVPRFGGSGIGTLSGSAPLLDASFGGVGSGFPGLVGGVSGGRCRDQTKYILTWTRALIPVTVYDTRTEYLPTTLYRYTTETQYYPVTAVRLETTTRVGGSELGVETKIAYRTNTVVVPRVNTITNTLVFTEDEHVTLTETDYLTRTNAQQYQLTVTVTQTQRVPQVQTSVLTRYETGYQTEYTTQRYNVVQTEAVSVPQIQYITQTETQLRYRTVAVTRTINSYQTVTKCGYPQRARY